MTTYQELDQQRAAEIARSDILHKIEAHGNYGQERCDTPQINLAKHISDHYTNMSLPEMRSLAARTLSDKEIRGRLLQCELLYHRSPPQSLSLPEFTKEATRLLARYTRRAGGYCIEDGEWTLHDCDSQDHSLMANEILFENSVSKYFVSSCREFMNVLTDKLDSLSDTVTVTKDELYLDDEVDNDDERTGLVWLIIKCRHSNGSTQDDTPPVISL